MNSRGRSLALASAVALLSWSINPPLTSPQPVTKNWLRQAGYGLNVAFFPGIPALPPAAIANGQWPAAVERFHVPTFVEDVRATGAKYVIFSVGQTSGFYTSYSRFYLDRTGTLVGQYIPQRDLVHEVARALKIHGIATIVYMAAEGPTAAPPEIRSRFPATNDRADPQNRAATISLVKEWAQRWGTDVAGWWIDGCYPGVTGYSNPTDGEANIDRLLLATKVANPQAWSTCNASSGLHRPLSRYEDFLAGEDERFQRYPQPGSQGQIRHRGRTSQWHVMSYLGNNWSDPRADRYGDEQLASYVKRVNDLGGVVSIDVAIGARGNIEPRHLRQLQRVRAVVRRGAALKTYPSLTRYQPAYLVSNRSATVELPVNGTFYQRYPSYGVDGRRDGQRVAQAGGEWPWSLLVDLRRASRFSRAAVTFPMDLYPTRYQILASDDLQTWRVVTTKEIDRGGTYTYGVPTTTARYVQLRALTPDGPNQKGQQMAVSEFELYP